MTRGASSWSRNLSNSVLSHQFQRGSLVSAASRSARSLMPRNILRSITREPGSIGNMPMRARRVGRRKRLRLISRVVSSCSSRTNVQIQLPSSERQASTCGGSTRARRIRFGAKADRVADLRMLELRQDAVDTVHVEAEKVLDPVVGVGAAARRRAHLRKPGPDRRGRRVDRDRTSRDSAGVLE